MSPERCCITSNRTDPPKVILLFGPTGVGKTALLERLFSRGAEVVSADALQVYKHLNIGTAKPGPDTLSRIPHHLIDMIDYTDSFSVGEFCRLADESVQDILSRGLLPVISGGTAYYLRAWLLGMPGTPPVDIELRKKLENKWRDRDDESLRNEVMNLDPVSAGRIGMRDRYRMLRVLEDYSQTGRPLSDFKVSGRLRDDFRTLCIGLRRKRAELYQRINDRVDQMFREGLESEVASLRKRGADRSHPGMKAIGYREWFGEPGQEAPGPERVKELIARNSRRYAKRQITFFASLPNVHWFDAGEDPDTTGGLRDIVTAFLDESASLDQVAPVGDNP